MIHSTILHIKRRLALNTLKHTLILPLLLSASMAHAQYLDGNTRAWGDLDYDDDPWVFNVSKPNFISKGLQNRHISLWAAHGYYFDTEKKKWKWQRPNLFGTVEDLFTSSIVTPFLMPMLEKAGAIVFSPRERDWQPREVIVDNDDFTREPYYTEIENGKKWKDADALGFAQKKEVYVDMDNPFGDGTVRQIKATKKKNPSLVSYQPSIPKDGRYAVYVSYTTLPNSVPDAHYIVYHKGIATEFTVNQKMGGGTWVYLGTFDFDGGCSPNNRVVVTNHSSKRGYVTTDAVRFGGGMGNIERGTSVSGVPRCIEGARYYAQWAGMPYNIYSGRRGASDYADDINVRSMMTNYLCGGSIYQPARRGLNVPLELSLAVHSDAGYCKDGKSTYGTLTICTSNFNEGVFSSGIPRITSKDFAKALRDNVVTDLRAKYGEWAMRDVWDRNYSETRLPDVPSAILETLSHQNFPDMKLGQDPMFKFTMARSVYKTLLRYITTNHGKEYVVQPLAPKNFYLEMDRNGYCTLNWAPQNDPQEPSAVAKTYNVYTAAGSNGFDNGRNVDRNYITFRLKPNIQYNFKITACNEGGESFPTEVLSAYFNPNARKTVLVVNNFHRLASPQVIDDGEKQGFDFDKDPGVPYGVYMGWSGKQTDFDVKKMGVEGPGGLGYCGNEMTGKYMCGNEFNYPVAHTEAIAATGKYNVISCSAEALRSGNIEMSSFKIVDLIEGLERNDGYTPEYYKTFTPTLQNFIRNFTKGGGKLLVSGSYVGSDMQEEKEKAFLSEIFKAQYATVDSAQIDGTVNGFGTIFDFHKELNEEHYAATHPDILVPATNGEQAMKYGDGNGAAVAYKGTDYASILMGFPFECIKSSDTRKKIMSGMLRYLDN